MITSVPKTTFNNTNTNQVPNSTGNFNLNASDFIKMMVTQLQNQDPLQPASNEQLLAQMSEIGQLQTSSQLQDTLKGLTLQNQIGSASSLIGKEVQGQDDNGAPISGLVNSVHVEKDEVDLELDSGKTLKLSQVTAIAGAPAGTTAATTPTTPAPTAPAPPAA